MERGSASAIMWLMSAEIPRCPVTFLALHKDRKAKLIEESWINACVRAFVRA